MTEVVLPALLYLFAVELCALAIWPLTWRVFCALPDRGYTLSKVLGPLVLVYGVWLLALLGWLALLRGTLIVGLAVIASLSWWRFGTQATTWAAARRRTVIQSEILFLAFFLLGALIRMFNAAIVGQEKFMDMALLGAFHSADRLPTADPWLSGFGVPYYHFSYLLLGSLGKLAGVGASYAYTLSLVYVFAAAAAGAASLVFNAVAIWQADRGTDTIPSPLVPGLLGAFFVSLGANLEAPLELLAARGLGSPAFWSFIHVRSLVASAQPRGLLPADGAWWFHASRVIPNISPDGISEFPFFSFLLGDLHPHFTALPLDLLALALALNLLVAEGAWRSSLQAGAAALALGALIVANTWDVAAFWGAYALCGAIVVTRVDSTDRRQVLLRLAATYAGAVMLFVPYFLGVASPPLGLGVVAERTPLVSLLIQFGPMLLMLAAAIGWLWQVGYGQIGLARLRQLAAGRVLVLVLLAVVPVAGLLLMREATLLVLALLALALTPVCAGLAIGHGRSDHPRLRSLQYLAVLAATAIALLLATEALYLSDAFASRMNTVFKLHYNVWVLLGLCVAACGYLAASSTGVPAFRPSKIAVLSTLVVVILLGAVYPLAATYSKSGGFQGRPTLDGAAFLASERAGDFAAVQWLNANAPGRPVVLEAVGGGLHRVRSNLYVRRYSLGNRLGRP